jgi:uncharacterized spore protein YtfJ
MSQAQEILESMAERFAATANAKQVFGEAIQADGRTIVPVARVEYRLGGGWGGGEQQENSFSAPRKGGGGGGGGQVTAYPLGALEISETGTRFIHFFDALQIVKAVTGGLIALLVVRRLLRRRK